MLADGLEFKDAILGTQHNLLTNTKKRKKKKAERIFPSKPKKKKLQNKERY